MLDQGVTKGFDMFSLKYEENSNTSTMKQKWILKKKCIWLVTYLEF